MSKQFVAIIVVIILAFVGVLTLTRKDNPTTSSATSEPSSHILGAGTKNVTLVEYGDFECPACKAYYPIVEQIKKDYGDHIKFQFRNFPLVQIHKNAFLGSRAAEAASNQGKFFEMYNLLYENQDAWAKSSDPSTVLQSFASQLSLNVDQFKTDMSSEKVAAVINADVKEAQKFNATSTPTFVLNGKKIDQNPKSIEEFKKLVDDEIAKSSTSN